MRQFRYAIQGETSQCHRLQVRGQRISAVAAISSAGVLTTDIFYGAVNSNNVYDFARGSLLPHMHSYDGVAPKSVVIMDKCSIHHVNPVMELFQNAGIIALFLPPYSPDYNPIELAFSSVKYFLQHCNASYE